MLFEYTKRDKGETGAALTAIELGSADGLPGLLARIEASPAAYPARRPGDDGLPLPRLTRAAGR